MTRPLRVLSLYEGFFAGGARILHSDVVAGLAARGQEHRVLSLTSAARRDGSLQYARDDARFRRLQTPGVQVETFERVAADRPLEPEGFTGEELERAAALFDSADVVLSLKEQPLSLVVALERAGLLPDRPSVACLHRSDPTHSGPALGWLRATGASGAITATISCAESTSLAYAHAGVSTTHAWVIDNGIDTRRFRPGTRAERRRIRAGLGIPDDAPVVLMAARFDAMKDPGLFLDAVRRHARRRPGTHYVMCGSGMTTSNPSFAALVDASDVPAGTALHALGLREDMPQLYRVADVVALTRLDAAGTDRAEVIAFLTSNTFPFHVRPRPTRAQIDEAINRGRWGGGDIETFWIDDEGRRIGVVRLDDLSDSTAMVAICACPSAGGERGWPPRR